MDASAREFALNIINQEHDLTLATVRPDGYPQAITVSYANDGLTIYVGTGKGSQKVNNIRHNNKVSLTINTDYQDWNHIKGLSMGGTAEILTDPEEVRRAAECLIKRYPEAAALAQTIQPSDLVFLRIEPQVISILDYEKGFGHTDLVTV